MNTFSTRCKLMENFLFSVETWTFFCLFSLQIGSTPGICGHSGAFTSQRPATQPKACRVKLTCSVSPPFFPPHFYISPPFSSESSSLFSPSPLFSVSLRSTVHQIRKKGILFTDLSLNHFLFHIFLQKHTQILKYVQQNAAPKHILMFITIMLSEEGKHAH